MDLYYKDSQNSIDDVDYYHNTLLANTNNLLRAVGISAKQILSVGELCRVASSMFVAVFESMFHVRLEGIIRDPKSREEYASNAQRVIDGLSQQIQVDLQHINGNNIVQGDVKSLSHLVTILVRINSIKSHESVQSSVSFPDNGNILHSRENGFHDNLSMSSRSISTHDSDFDDDTNYNNSRYSGKKNDAGRLHTYESSGSKRKELTKKLLQNSRSFSKDDVERLCATDANEILERGQRVMKLEEKLEAARLRRERLKGKRERDFFVLNKKKNDKRNQAMQKRWLEDQTRDKDAYKLRKSNEEQVMLRKIYKGLLHKMHEWRVDEHIEVRERVNMIRDETKNHIKSLQTLFEDRLRVLREQDMISRTNDEEIISAQKRMGAEIKQSYSGRQKKYIEDQANLLSQKRKQLLLRRQEAHRNLLALLSIENWNEMLRQNCDV